MALEVGDGQRHRLGHALDGQVARQAHRLVAVERHPARLEGDGRVLGGVEEIRGLDVLVEQRIAGVDRGGVDGHVDRAGFGGTVEHHLAAGLVELVGLVGEAQVVVGEMRVGMAVVDDIGDRRGLGGGGQRRQVRRRGQDVSWKAP